MDKKLFMAPDFSPIFFVHEQHAKAFTLMFAEMLVVHFMCPSNRFYVGVIASAEPFESLVDDHVMDQEIGETVGHDAQSDRLFPPDIVYRAKEYQKHAW